MAEQNILIVEDDRKINRLLHDYLVNTGYRVSILDRGYSVITEVKTNPPDLIILDIMLPDKDGMVICQEIRTFSQVPIIMLTAKVDEIDRVLGLELGADDYICKPFSPREVVSRVKCILRRTDAEQYEENITAGPITINNNNHDMTIKGKNLRLTPVEFKLLKLMASKPGNVLSRNYFVTSIQSEDFAVSERIIDSHIKNIRKKMEEVLPGNNIIQTIYGIGYSLNILETDN